jgi:hypothetical protein
MSRNKNKKYSEISKQFNSLGLSKEQKNQVFDLVLYTDKDERKKQSMSFVLFNL